MKKAKTPIPPTAAKLTAAEVDELKRVLIANLADANVAKKVDARERELEAALKRAGGRIKNDRHE